MEYADSPVHTHHGTTSYFKRCAILAAFGGTFFGFDQSVVSNSFALLEFSQCFVRLLMFSVSVEYWTNPPALHARQARAAPGPPHRSLHHDNALDPDRHAPEILPSEVLPTHLRAKGAALSTSFTFPYNLCVSKTTPLLFVSIGYKTYFYYAGLCALSTLITLFFLPETQGLSREELDGVFEYAPYVVWYGKYRVDNAMILNKWATGPALGEEKLRSEDEEHVEVVSEKRQ